MDAAQELLIRLGWFFVGATAVVVIVAYLGRIFLRHILTAELEAYKQQLQMEGVMAMERVRSESRRGSADRDQRSAKLQDKQAEVMAELYKRMVVLRNAVTKITSPHPADAASQPGKVDAVVSAGEQLADYFDQHRIFLDEGLCRKLQGLQAAFFDAWVKHSFAVAKDQYVRQGKGGSSDTWKKLSEEVPTLLQDIEQDFRSLLGPRPSLR